MFILVTDLPATGLHPQAWARQAAEAQARIVAESCRTILGFKPIVDLADIDGLSEVIIKAVEQESDEIFVLPAALEFNLLQRETLGRLFAELRRAYPRIALHHDDLDPAHPLLVECLADQVARAIPSETGALQHTGLLLAPSGHGDADSRAYSFRLMRLIWERLGLAAGEVGFVRHAQPFLAPALVHCIERSLNWVILPQAQWRTDHVEFAAVILENFQRQHPEAARWRMAETPGAHPAITAWLVQRITRLWNDKRTRESLRVASPKQTPAAKPVAWNLGQGVVASVPDRRSMSELLKPMIPAGKPDRILVKVTWHGYATGTYTDPAALDLLLGALPAPAIIVEGHTSSRNIGDADFDWERDARDHRAWIRQQDAEYLRRTGLSDVIAKHSAAYVNVTEAYWDEACAAPACIRKLLDERGVALEHPELLNYVPAVLLAHLGSPMISFAKLKGPTRLGISNLFGLIPDPLRSTWHGPNVTYFARVCCNIAKLYRALFPLSVINEGLYSAVRWNRKGLYRSRWGNYDLISDAGYVTASCNIAAADILASRLQGQDVKRSAFFDVVRAELEWDEEAATDPLPQGIQCLFA